MAAKSENNGCESQERDARGFFVCVDWQPKSMGLVKMVTEVRN